MKILPASPIRRVLPMALAATIIPFAAAALTPGFPLTDSAPGSPDFKRQFEASFALHPSIEPPLSPRDRELYQEIEPWLEDEPDRAIEWVERERTTDNSPAFAYLLGNLYYQKAEWDDAEAALQEAIAAYPAFRRAHRTLGLVLIRRERYVEAAETWQRVIALGGGDAQSYGLLGYAWLQQSHFASSLHAYRMARMFDPNRIDFRRGEAHALYSMGEYRQAIAMLDELIAQQPDNAEYWRLQANVFLQVEAFEQALINLEILRGLGQATADTLLLLGDLYLQQDLLDLALPVFEEALGADVPANPERVLRPLYALLAADRLDEAEQYLHQVQAAYPSLQHPEIQLTQARLELAQEDAESARTRVETVLDQSPLHAQALLLMGYIHLALSNPDSALLSFQRVQGDLPAELDAALEQARIYIDRNQVDSALPLLRLIHSHRPSTTLQQYIQSLESPTHPSYH